ncbi:MAG: thioredoxin family protein [Bacteroidota bacterium]
MSFLLPCFCQILSAQEINQTYVDDAGKMQLIGLCDRNALEQDSFKTWYQAEYNAYEPDEALIEKAKHHLDDISIEIFMATWCGDSRREVPRFYKILDALAVSDDNISLINVYRKAPRYKQSPTHEEVGKLLHRVPTFIVYRDGKEIGRIVEFPGSSLEMDLVQILVGLPSAPQYKVVAVVDQRLAALDSMTDRQALLNIAREVYKFAHNDRGLNTYGYVLMSRDEVDKAIAVFTINAMLNSKEPNVYDSLGEAYERKEDFESALYMYQAVVSLDPENEHALTKIAELEQKQEP